MSITLEAIRAEIEQAQQPLREQTAQAIGRSIGSLEQLNAQQAALKGAYVVLACRLAALGQIDLTGLANDIDVLANAQADESIGSELLAIATALGGVCKRHSANN